jgi:hypothetical protein
VCARGEKTNWLSSQFPKLHKFFYPRESSLWCLPNGIQKPQ